MAPSKPRGPKPGAKGAPPKSAGASNDLQTFVTNARERKKHEDLAAKIFGAGKNRRQSAPSNLKPNVGGSLASRVGVKKTRASLGPRSQTTPAGDINAEWTHDLHRSKTNNKKPTLASRINPIPTGPKAQRNSRAANLNRMDIDSPAIKSQANIRPAAGLSIRGLAGPFVVMGQNFAPGTTAADVESAMTPIGGEMESCKVVKTSPFMVVEMVFASREGGERVIQTFNEKTADGRLLKVYPKVGATPTGPRSDRQKQASDQIVDGTMGFPEPKNHQGGLYSDNMVNNSRSRGGRGGQRGRNGR